MTSIEKKWLEDLKIAIINENIDDITKSSYDIPSSFENVEDFQAALSLIERAKELIEDEQTKIAKEMNAIKQTKKYLA